MKRSPIDNGSGSFEDDPVRSSPAELSDCCWGMLCSADVEMECTTVRDLVEASRRLEGSNKDGRDTAMDPGVQTRAPRSTSSSFVLWRLIAVREPAWQRSAAWS